MKILETERLILREIVAADAEFILDLLNQPSFIRYIGDRGVRTREEALEFIESRYRRSYRENGFGLYLVELKSGKNPEAANGTGAAAETIARRNTPIGICGFVRRDGLPHADIGFAFLPQFEKKGYAFESAAGALDYGRKTLNLGRILAVTTKDNESSIKLLGKLGFSFEGLINLPTGAEELKLFSAE